MREFCCYCFSCFLSSTVCIWRTPKRYLLQYFKICPRRGVIEENCFLTLDSQPMVRLLDIWKLFQPIELDKKWARGSGLRTKYPKIETIVASNRIFVATFGVSGIALGISRISQFEHTLKFMHDSAVPSYFFIIIILIGVVWKARVHVRRTTSRLLLFNIAYVVFESDFFFQLKPFFEWYWIELLYWYCYHRGITWRVFYKINL